MIEWDITDSMQLNSPGTNTADDPLASPLSNTRMQTAPMLWMTQNQLEGLRKISLCKRLGWISWRILKGDMKTDCKSSLRGNGSDLSELDIQLEVLFRNPYSVLVRFTFVPGALLSCFPNIVAV